MLFIRSFSFRITKNAQPTTSSWLWVIFYARGPFALSNGMTGTCSLLLHNSLCFVLFSCVTKLRLPQRKKNEKYQLQQLPNQNINQAPPGIEPGSAESEPAVITNYTMEPTLILLSSVHIMKMKYMLLTEKRIARARPFSRSRKGSQPCMHAYTMALMKAKKQERKRGNEQA